MIWCSVAWIMDIQWVFFSKISQIDCWFGQMGRINCGVFPVELSLCDLVHDYQLINHYFYKNKTFWDLGMNLDFKKLRIQPICVHSPCSEQHDNFVKNTSTTFSCLYIKQGYWVYRSGFESFSISWFHKKHSSCQTF